MSIDHVSHSMLEAWNRCRLYWKFQYIDRLAPIGRNFHLDLGVGVHEGLAAYYKHGEDPVAVFDRWVKVEKDKVRNLPGSDDPFIEAALEKDMETLDEISALGRVMLKGYLGFYRNEKLTVVATEKTVLKAVPGTDIPFESRIDTVVRDSHRGKKLYVLEHKTFTRFTPAYLPLDHQFVAEAWCAEELTDGEPVAGTIYNGLRKQVPGRTKEKLFERHTVDVSQRAVDLFHKRVRDYVRTLERGKIAVYPEPSAIKCGGCTFKDPCTLMVKGDDYQFVLDNLFQARSTDHREKYED